MILSNIITTAQFLLELKSQMFDCILTTMTIKTVFHKKNIKRLITRKKEVKLKVSLKNIKHKIESNQLKIIQSKILNYGFFLIRENKVKIFEVQIKNTLLIILY